MSMLNWRRDPGYEQRMKLLRVEIEDAKRRSLASEMRTKLIESEIEELDLKLRNFYELESRLKHGKPSSPTLPSHPLPTESSSSKS